MASPADRPARTLLDMTERGEDPRRPPLLELIVAGGSLLGVVLAVLGLDIDRTMRAVAISLLTLAAVLALVSLVAARFRRIALGGAVGMALVAVGVLALAPSGTPATTSAVNSPAPSGLVVSSLEVLAAGPERAAEVDVSLRNPGTTRVGLTEVEVTIVDSAVVQVCLFASATDVSGSYDLELPDHPAPGTVLRKTLHQEIGPDELDRFTLRLGAPQLEAKHPLDSYLYRVRVAIAHDGGTQPVELGEFVVEAQNGLSTDHYFPAARPATLEDAKGAFCGDSEECQRRILSCWNANRVPLERLLAGDPQLSEGAARAKTTLFG